MTQIRYSDALTAALREEMIRDDRIFLFGEDIGNYGGVFKVTKGLMNEFGGRVRDTPISEQTLTAMAVSASMTGTRPILEIMFADFLPLCLDALVNQASVFSYVWGDDVKMPFVLRTQGGGGVGTGAQHAKTLDSLVAHIPGIVLMAPATAADAKGMLKSAIRSDRPVVFMEHKLLYNLRGEVPEGDYEVEIGKARIARSGSDVTLVATSKMVLECEAAAETLAAEGVSAEVVDLRSLRPLDLTTLEASVSKTHRAVVVHEGWRFCGYSAELAATIAERCFDELDAPVERVTLADMPIPYSEDLESAVLPNAAKVSEAAKRTLEGTGIAP